MQCCWSPRMSITNGRGFILNKFRTMTDGRDHFANLLPDDDRLTAFGRRLRSTSLDGLPTLLNVINGEMSLVGPRPLLVQYLDRYTPEQARRHDVRPGMTGWAQVNGRNPLDWKHRLALDVWYVDHLTWYLDLRILAKTTWKTLLRECVSFPGQATMHEFEGATRNVEGPPGGAR